MTTEQLSNWRGSATTYELVKSQIIARWGQEAGAAYDPRTNCLTYKQWQSLGYQVKAGEKSIRSFIMIEKKDEEGNVVERRPKRINLFYSCQVEQAK